MIVLKIENVSKQYGTFTAVDHLNLTIFQGETIGLLGPNGAGKSTTISMIATLFKPSSGEMTYKGKSIIKNPEVIQSDLGYVPQEIALYDRLSGYENLYYFGGLYGLNRQDLKMRIKEVSEIIGIKERLKHKVETYSGGMKRRLNIGVALMHQPKIIIMDEPTVGIDPQSRNHILETVKTLNQQGITVIYTSHYMEEISQLCKRIYIMDHGKIIAEGTQEALLEQAAINPVLKVTFEKGFLPSLQEILKEAHVVGVEVEDDRILYIEYDVLEQNAMGAFILKFPEVISFDRVKPDLEQVFLKLTGRGLRD
jgi:ABC-2 type transport system ATP-binding protein